ncbi:MAG: plasmid replication/partition related protein [Stenotrophomonas sp.]
MDIIVKEELKAYIDPLTADEYESLERSLLAEGCRDALVLWGNVLIDGHNRYGICRKHDIPFNTVQNTRFKSMDDVHLWMIEQHLGRRSVSDYQRGVLALRKRDIIDARRRAEQEKLRRESEGETASNDAGSDTDSPPWEPAPKLSKADLAREAKLSPSQVTMIEKIHDHATPEVIEAMRTGAISLSAAATVASLPEAEQRAAALAGKDELKQAAKRVRDAKRKPKADAVADNREGHKDDSAGTDAAAASAEVEALRQRVSTLTAENQALRMELDALRSRLHGSATVADDA